MNFKYPNYLIDLIRFKTVVSSSKPRVWLSPVFVGVFLFKDILLKFALTHIYLYEYESRVENNLSIIRAN
jgi:hypothetical protein